jgi:hypothetical protein
VPRSVSSRSNHVSLSCGCCIAASIIGAESVTSWRGWRQEYDVELRRYNGRGWRAVFFLSGFEHSLTADAGSAWAPSPWEAVQRAPADALRKREAPAAAPRDWTLTDESPR